MPLVLSCSHQTNRNQTVLNQRSAVRRRDGGPVLAGLDLVAQPKQRHRLRKELVRHKCSCGWNIYSPAGLFAFLSCCGSSRAMDTDASSLPQTQATQPHDSAHSDDEDATLTPKPWARLFPVSPDFVSIGWSAVRSCCAGCVLLLRV